MSEALLLMQIRTQMAVIQCWDCVTGVADSGRQRVNDDRDRGEVTATTVLIVILVAAAVAAAGVIASKIENNANNIQDP